MRMNSRLAIFLASLLAVSAKASAENSDPLTLIDRQGLFVRAHLQGGINFVSEKNLYWNLASRFAATALYNPDKTWFESYVKPGMSLRYQFSSHWTAYGKFSVVLSDTRGKDAYDVGNTGRAGLEEAYAGVRYAEPGGTSIDISAGSRELKLGTGMIIANGGSNGFERGAIKLGPRKA